MRKTQKGIALPKKSGKGIHVYGGGFVRRLTRADERAQAKFILNNWGL